MKKKDMEITVIMKPTRSSVYLFILSANQAYGRIRISPRLQLPDVHSGGNFSDTLTLHSG